MSRLEDSQQARSYFKSAHNTMQELKHRYDKLHNSSKQKQHLLNDLLSKLETPTELISSRDLPAKLKQTEDSLDFIMRQIEDVEGLSVIYEDMRTKRAVKMKVLAGRYRKLNEEVKEMSKKLKERQTEVKCIERDLERMTGAEAQFTAKNNALQIEREEKIKAQLLMFQGSVAVEAFTDKTRSRRKLVRSLKAKEQRLTLLEEALDQAKKAEALKADLDACNSEVEARERSLYELKKVTRAETAEDMVLQYEEVLRRRKELEQIESQYAEQIEAKKAELDSLKTAKHQLDKPDDEVKDLVRLESSVLYRESSRNLMETDLNSLTITAAQMTNFLQHISTRLKDAWPDGKLCQADALRTEKMF